MHYFCKSININGYFNMKNEKEKILLGEIYDVNNDLQLIAKRDNCKEKYLLLFHVFAGLMMLPFGLGKIENFDTYKIDFFGDPIGIGMVPSLVLTIFAQVVCTFALTVGFFSRSTVFILAFNMLIVAKFHWHNDFTTLSLPLLFLGIYCMLTLWEGGKYSIDSLLFNRNIKVK